MGVGWREFWDRPHKIYVSRRHRAVHYARVADDIVDELPSVPATVLDYGCGEAIDAARVAARTRTLILCEAAGTIREGLAQRFAGEPTIAVIAPEDIPGLADGALDLIVVNSVLQYLSPDECRALLTGLRAKLATTGRLVVADVIPPDCGLMADVRALLATAMRHRFLLAALAGLAATLKSEYRRLRQTVGLSTWTEAELTALLHGAGFAATRRPRNFGFNQRRMTFIARKAD